MSGWKDYKDFMKDVLSTSEFDFDEYHYDKPNKFAFHSTDSELLRTPWYDSDSDGDSWELEKDKEDHEETEDSESQVSSHELMNEIRLQVRNTIGNRYNNEVLEKYYNIYRDASDTDDSTINIAPKEVSIKYAKDQILKMAQQSPIISTSSDASSVKKPVSKLVKTEAAIGKPSINCSSSSSSSPVNSAPEYTPPGKAQLKRKNGKRNKHKLYNSQISPVRSKNVNIFSESEFPPLS